MNQKQIRAAVEAMLFACAEPIGADKLAQAVQLPQVSVEAALEALRERWHTGVLLAQYVFTAYENGERTDFYKAYLAVRPR